MEEIKKDKIEKKSKSKILFVIFGIILIASLAFSFASYLKLKEYVILLSDDPIDTSSFLL